MKSEGRMSVVGWEDRERDMDGSLLMVERIIMGAWLGGRIGKGIWMVAR